MKYAKTYEGAAVFFERLSDDGWSEDAGEWPERYDSQTYTVAHLKESLQKGRYLSPAQFFNVFAGKPQASVIVLVRSDMSHSPSAAE